MAPQQRANSREKQDPSRSAADWITVRSGWPGSDLGKTVNVGSWHISGRWRRETNDGF